jgi:hypothetical protein
VEDQRRRQLEQRHDYGEWRGRSAHAAGPTLRGYTFSGEEIPSGDLKRVDRKAGPPPRITSMWGRRGGSPEEILRVDVFELSTVEAAHDYVIELLDEFQATDIRRREPPPVGDVAFGTPLVLLFARANLVVLVRNAGRSAVEVATAARELDVHLVGLLTRSR